MSFDTLFDALFRPVIYGILFLGLLSLLVGRVFIKRRHFAQAAETLWFVTLGVLLCFGVVFYAQNDRLDTLRIQVEEIQEKVEHHLND